MKKPNPLMLLADKFQAADPSLTREAAILRAGDEVNRFKAGKGLSPAACDARALSMRADAIVRQGKRREDAIIQASEELRYAAARSSAEAHLKATAPRGQPAARPRSESERRAAWTVLVNDLEAKGVAPAAAMNLAWRETA